MDKLELIKFMKSAELNTSVKNLNSLKILNELYMKSDDIGRAEIIDLCLMPEAESFVYDNLDRFKSQNKSFDQGEFYEFLRNSSLTVKDVRERYAEIKEKVRRPYVEGKGPIHRACGGDNTIIELVQIAKGDEGATQQNFCKDCGRKFR